MTERPNPKTHKSRGLNFHVWKSEVGAAGMARNMIKSYGLLQNKIYVICTLSFKLPSFRSSSPVFPETASSKKDSSIFVKFCQLQSPYTKTTAVVGHKWYRVAAIRG